MATSESQNQGTTASSPGAILKRCREYHGITLEEAAAETRIGVSYLEALENDRTGEFASLAYLKGFLRIYTAHLGLNNDDMVRLYEKLYAPESSNGKTLHKEEAATSKRTSFNWRKLALPALLLLLIIICSALINRSSTPPRKEPPPQPANAGVPAPPVQPRLSSASPLPAPVKIKEKPVAAEKAADDDQPPEQAKARPQPPEHAKGFIVRMRVTHNGSLTVVIDSGNSQQYDLTSGDVIEWKAERSVALDLSNGGGVEVEQNGKALKSFGPAGKPAYVLIEADGVKQQ